MKHNRDTVGKARRRGGACRIDSALILGLWIAVFIGGALPATGAMAQAGDRPPPPWWYDPLTPSTAAAPTPDTPPSWWYAPGDASMGVAGDADVSPQAFGNLSTAVDLPSSQGLNAGVIPLHVQVTADGTTPEIVVQVTSEQVPDQAVFAGYTKRPDGAVQNLYGFQQAQFIGGVGTDGVADVIFHYEALTTGWVEFTVKIWMDDHLIRGPETHAIYVSPVAPGFTDMNASVSLDASRCLNAGAIPLTVAVTADGPTPEIIVQVVSDDVPDRAVYAGYEKQPDGAVQNLYGFQQARFPGGVGSDNTATITFWYEPLVVGTLNFTVKVWVGDNLWYGPVDHAIYVCEVSPNFTSLDVAVDLPASQGLNAGVIPLNVRVTASGRTPEVLIHVVSDDVPDRAVYVGADKTPEGTVQNMYGFQQARFPGGVGPDGVAETTFQYESLSVGWVVFTVKVYIGDHLWYGPVQHAVYLWEAGAPSTICPPLIYEFALAAQEDHRATFSMDGLGNPEPQYTLACGSANADADVANLRCDYHTPGTYVATLTAASYFKDGVPAEDGVRYTDSATATVTVQGADTPPPDPVDAPTFTWTGVVTWTGVMTRRNAAGEVVSMTVTLLEPLAVPTGTWPITVTYTTVMATRRTVYGQDGQVTALPDTGAQWRATAANAGGSANTTIYAGQRYPAIYLPLVVRR